MPDILDSRTRITDPDYFKHLNEFLCSEPAVLPNGEENIELITGTVATLFCSQTKIKKDISYKHLRVSLTFEIPFLVLDKSVLDFIKDADAAIDSIFLTAKYKALEITVLVNYFQNEESPHIKATKKTLASKNGNIEMEFLP